MSSFDPNKDGIDHINAYSQSNSWLGLRLSNFDYSPINHPKDGHFKSLEGYWYFSLTGDERFRELHGIDAKKLGKSFNKEDRAEIGVDFKKNFYLALKEKIYSNKKLKDELIKCNLPIVHYYIKKDESGSRFIVPVNRHSWIWDQVHAIRCELQGKECNLDLFGENEEKNLESGSQLSFF